MKIFFIVIEARKPCFKGWTLEYHGYLMAGHYTHEAGTTYTCIDSHPDTLHGGSTNNDGRLFYLVEATCGSLKCSPYVEGNELIAPFVLKNKTINMFIYFNISCFSFECLENFVFALFRKILQ